MVSDNRLKKSATFYTDIFHDVESFLFTNIFHDAKSFLFLKNLIRVFYTRRVCYKLYIWGTTRQLICLEVWQKYHMRYFNHGGQCKMPPDFINLHVTWNPSKPITHENCMKGFVQALGRCDWLMIKELKYIRSLKFHSLVEYVHISS